MERRYLVAALAIVATFAVFSRGLRALEHFSLSYEQHVGMNSQAKCNSGGSAASRMMAKVKTHLRPGYAEEAQLLAEMNLPIVMAQAKVAQQFAQQNVAAAQCARATALRQAERAQREAMRMREKMARTRTAPPAMPIAWGMNTADDVNARIQERAAAIAEQVAAQNVRIQMAADRVREVSVRIADSDTEAVDSADADQDADDNSGKARCNAALSQRQQVEKAIRDGSRAIVYQVVQQAFGNR